jgi:hypothetical protein
MTLIHKHAQRFFFMLICCAAATTAYSQRKPITIYRTFGGARFERDSVLITLRQTADLLTVDPQASPLFIRARQNYSAAGVIGFAGGVLVALPLGTAIAGGQPEWGLAAGGAALVLLSIPFQRAFIRHAAEAVDVYNGRPGARQFKPKLKAGQGCWVALRF